MSTSSMHVAKTGLNAQQTRMQIIANNLANVSTTGFKRDRANFETLLYQVRRVAGDQTTAETNLTSSFSVGTGARIVNTQKNMSQGSINMGAVVRVSRRQRHCGQSLHIGSIATDFFTKFAVCRLLRRLS